MKVTKEEGLAAGAIVLFAGLSVWLQGFAFGAGNNVFHIPIVQHAFDWPQFADDGFYQGLKSYTSIFWTLLGLFGPAAASFGVFLALHLIIRILTFWAIHHLLGLFLEGWPRLAALCVIVFSPFVSGSSVVGDHDMLIYSLNHTSACWPLLFLSLVLLTQNRITFAFALNGALFALNGFVAAWHGAALGAGLIYLIANNRGQARDLIKRAALGFILALIIAAPVLAWYVKAASAVPAYPPFDYRDFLRLYWPNHFFIDAAPLRAQIKLLVITLVGAIALVRLGKPARVILWAYGGYCAVFALGVALPHFTDSRTLLNLHLLRVAGVIQFIAVIAAGAIGARDLTGKPALALCGAVTLLGLIIPKDVPIALIGVAAPLLIGRFGGSWETRLAPVEKIPRIAIFALLCLFAIAASYRTVTRLIPRGETIWADEQALGAWLKANTDPRAEILAPAAAQIGGGGVGELQLFSQRRVYVDWKRGATVMWRPDYYAPWRQRLEEVRALGEDPAAITDFACAHDLAYIVMRTGAPLVKGAPVYSNPHFAVFDAKAACAP